MTNVVDTTSVEAVHRTPLTFIRSLLVLSKPGIAVSVSFTGFAGIALATRAFPRFDTALLAILALLLSAVAASILNNVLDKSIDVQMDRLNKRVKALEIVGEKEALALAFLFIVISLFISIYFFNIVFACLIVIAILSYTVLYTLYLKRSSPYGTILGGIPGAIPVLAGFAAVNPDLDMSAWILFLIMMLWQPPHFWALAQMYRSDYSKAGIPVLPVAFGTKFTNILTLIYSISLLPMTLSLWFFGYCSEYFAIVSLAVGLYYVYMVVTCIKDDANYKKAFGVSILYILLVMAAVIVDVGLNPLYLLRG